MKLTRNFTLEELTFSQTAARRGIDNTPPPEVVTNLMQLAETLERVRALVRRPIYVSSGYRSHELNAAVGGSAFSAHKAGLAADINAKGMTPFSLAQSIAESGIEFDQLILEFDSWVHLGLAVKPRKQCLTIRRGTGYMPGIIA